MKIVNLYAAFDTMHGATKWAMSFASELANQGHDSKIVCSRFKIERPYWLQAEIVCAKRSLTTGNRLLRVVANYLNVLSLFWLVDKDSDVLVFHTEASTALLPLMRLRCPKAKIIYYCYQPPREVYDLWPLVQRDFSPLVRVLLSAVLPVYRMLDRFLVRQADLVLVWSDEYEEYIKEIYGIDCVEQLPACVDFGVFARHDLKIERRLADRYKSAEKVLLMNATLTRKKRADLLVKALVEMKERDRNIHALVIGEGELKEELLALANSLGVADRLHLLGYVSQQELPCFYFIADLLFYLEPDGAWSLSIIEAAAAKLPVIVAPGGSMPTLVRDGITGVVLPEYVDEKIVASESLKLLDDEISSKEMGEANYQHLEQYSLENAIGRFLRLLE